MHTSSSGASSPSTAWPELHLVCLPWQTPFLQHCLESLAAWPSDRLRVYATEALDAGGIEVRVLADADALWNLAWNDRLGEGWHLLIQADESLSGWTDASWQAFAAEPDESDLGLCAVSAGSWLSYQARLVRTQREPILPQPQMGPGRLLDGVTLLGAEPPRAELERQLASLLGSTGLPQLLEQARILQSLGRSAAAIALLADQLTENQLIQRKSIRIFRSNKEPRLDVARMRLCLEDPGARPQAQLMSLQALLERVPKLETTPESWALKGAIAWNMGQLDVALTCFQQALAEDSPALGWSFLPLTRGLPHLRLGQLALLDGDDARAREHLEQAGPALAGHPLLLQLAYADFLIGEPAGIHAQQQLQQQRFGLVPPLLRLIDANLNHRPTAETLLGELLERPPGGPFERLLLHRLLSQLPPETCVALLKDVQTLQPEWRLALGTALRQQGRAADALQIWQPLYAAHGAQLPVRLLRQLAEGLARLGARAQARRCLEKALLAKPADAELSARLGALLAEAYADLRHVVELVLPPEWTNGGDLALKVCFQTWGDRDGVLVCIPGDWNQAVIKQALAWAHQHTEPDALPIVWCGRLPESLTRLRTIRLAPWRQPQAGQALEVELQPNPSDPASGPLYMYCRETREQVSWLEMDPVSLQRWLRASVQQQLPRQQLVQVLRPPEVRTAMGLALAKGPEQAQYNYLARYGMIFQFFTEVYLPTGGQSWTELIADVREDWVLCLTPIEEMHSAYLGYLGQLTASLPAEVQAVAFGARGKDNPALGIWPVFRLVRRELLAQMETILQTGLFTPLLDARGQDLKTWYLPEIALPSKILPEAADWPGLNQAWYTLNKGNLSLAAEAAAKALLQYPHSRQVANSALRLQLAILAERADWPGLLAATAEIGEPTAAVAYYAGLARQKLGQPAQQAFGLALELTDALAPQAQDLLPRIERAALVAALQTCQTA
ncbi:MAG: hypothetical protein ACAI44_24950 [Candidatus Sericytochromatia bacterium]